MGRKGGRHNFRTNNKPFKVPVDHVKHKGNFADGLQKAGLNVTGAVAMADDFSEANQKMTILFALATKSYDKDPLKRDPKVPVPSMRKIRSSMMIAHGLKPEFEEDAEDIQSPMEDSQVPVEDNTADIDSMKGSHLCLNRWCTNGRHITIESAPDNLRRNTCALNGECTDGLSPPCKIDQKMT